MNYELLRALRDFENAVRLHELGMCGEDLAASRFDVLLDELSNTGWLVMDEDDPAVYVKA